MENKPFNSLTISSDGGRVGKAWQIFAKDDLSDVGKKQRLEAGDFEDFIYKNPIAFEISNGRVIYTGAYRVGMEYRLEVLDKVINNFGVDEDPEYPTSQRERGYLSTHAAAAKFQEIIDNPAYKLSILNVNKDHKSEIVNGYFDVEGSLQVISVFPYEGSRRKSKANTLVSNTRFDLIGGGVGSFILQVRGEEGQILSRQIITSKNGRASVAGFSIRTNIFTSNLVNIEFAVNNQFVNEVMNISIASALRTGRRILLLPTTITHNQIPFNDLRISFEDKNPTGR